MLLRTVRATIDKYGMLQSGDRTVVAVSGGPDSVALLHALLSLKQTYGIDIHAAHLEHGIRGDESAEDMRFVEDLCRSLCVPVSVRRADIPAAARGRKISVEAAARKARYRFFEEVLKTTGSNKIATGHNANDRAETVLLNIIRGAGLAGLSGIRPAASGIVVRPLIETTRSEILAYLESNGIPFRVDSTNLDDRYERNRVRRILLPLLEEKFNPRIVDALARTADVFSVLDGYLRDEVRAATRKCCETEHGQTVINLEAFRQIPYAVRLFTLYSILRSLEGDEQVVSFEGLNAVLDLAAGSRSGARIDVGSGIVVSREFDTLVVGRDLASGEAYEIELEVPGSAHAEAAECTLTAEVLEEEPGKDEVSTNGATVYFDAGALKFPLTVRSWREGDRLVPFGFSGSKKVHDVFIDEKVPVSRRPKIPIVCDGRGIIWIAGVRRADRARITDATKRIIKITLRRDG